MLPVGGGGGFDPSLGVRGGGGGGRGRGKAATDADGRGQHNHPANVVKDLKRSAGKATKGLLGFVGNAVQRTAEILTHQEMAVGVYKVQIVKQMAEGGGCEGGKEGGKEGGREGGGREGGTEGGRTGCLSPKGGVFF